MRTQSTGITPWQKILKFITNPTVEVIAAILVVLVSAWIVIETDSTQRRPAYPVLFGK
jgi:hypothetical protein